MKKISRIAFHFSFLTLLFSGNNLMAQNARPNFIVICGDDLSYNSVSMNDPNAVIPTNNINRIGQEGLNVTKYYSTNSLCVPGRATLLSGKYGHTTGCYNNNTNLSNSINTVPKILHNAGYYTALCGKWMVSSSTPKPEFDYWLWTPGKSTYFNDTCKYFNTEFVATGHITDMLTDSVLALIARVDTPFCIYMNHNAPHAPLIPQTQYDDAFDSLTIYQPLNYPMYTQNYPNVVYNDPGFFISSTTEFQNQSHDYAELVAGIDESVGKILDSLQALGRLDNTMIIFTTDNGFMIGPHQLKGKEYPYEETTKMSMLIRYPTWFGAGATISNNSFVINTDVAPTMLQAAGINYSGYGMQGKSIKEIYNNQFYRDKFLYEIVPPVNNNIPQVRSVRDNYFEYTRYYAVDTTEELFDMVNDPLQMNNLVHNCYYQTTLHQYRTRLDSMRTAMNDALVITPNADCHLLNPVYTCCNSSTQNIVASICSPNTYELGGNNFGTTGNYSDTMTNAGGCDSIVHLTLTVHSSSSASSNQSICQGNTFNFPWGGSTTIAGNYSHTYNSVFGCDSVVTINLSIISVTNPTISASSITICGTGSVLLTSSAGTNYQWKKNNVNVSGATNQTYSATATALYTVSQTDLCGTHTSAGTQVTKYSLPTATVSAIGSTAICSTDSVHLTVTTNASPNVAYQWYKSSTAQSGATNANFYAKSAGNYKVKVTNTSTGCEKISGSIAVTITDPTATISASGPTTFCAGGSVTLTAVTNAGAGATYQWYKTNTALAGATNISYLVTVAGNYKVKVTNSIGCSKTSAYKKVTINCRLENELQITENGFQIFPNPADENITVTLSQPCENCRIEITNTLGQILYSANMIEQTAICNLKLIPMGIYFLTVRNEQFSVVKKFVKE